MREAIKAGKKKDFDVVEGTNFLLSSCMENWGAFRCSKGYDLSRCMVEQVGEEYRYCWRSGGGAGEMRQERIRRRESKAL